MLLLIVACWSSFESKDTAQRDSGAPDSKIGDSGDSDSGDSDSGDSDSGDSPPVDADGDGYTTGDCDESSAAVYPGADERCNGIDDDCDDSVDEEATDASTWFVDEDGDNWGSSEVMACEAEEGLVPDGGDCDDADADVHPGATELCNGWDDDCDEDIDGGAVDAATWYEDLDEDAWGGAEVSACEQPAGTLDSGGDCDDGEASANPDGVEACDEIDNDCDGDVDEAGGSTWYTDADGDGLGDDTTAVVTCTPGSGAVGVGGDCDDGDGDVLDSAPLIFAEDFESGHWAEVVGTLDCIDGGCESTYGGFTHRGLMAADTQHKGDEIGVSASAFTSDFTLVAWFYDARAGDDRLVVELGTSATNIVAWAGFDTDQETGQYLADNGTTSVPLGARTEGWHRLIVEAVYTSSTTGDLTFTLDSEAPASLTFSGYMSAFWFDDTGTESAYVDDLAAWAGTGACAPTDSYTWYTDRDGDGYGEPGTGMFTDLAPSGAADNVGDCDDGEVLAWADAAEVCDDGVDQDCDAEYDGCGFLGENVEGDAESGIWFDGVVSEGVSAGGDVDGDGGPDLLTSAAGRDSVRLFTGGWDSLQYYALAGTSWANPSGGVGAGMTIAPDLSGDGCDDIVISQTYPSASVAVVYGCTYATGERPLYSVADTTLGATTDGEFGVPLVATPDADGDGVGELFLAAYSDSNSGGTHAGVVFRMNGVSPGSVDVDALAAASIVGEPDDYLGTALASAGDTEGTGGAGILVGAYLYDGGTGTSTGRVSLFDAAATGQLTYADAMWSVEGGPGDALGNGTSGRPLAGIGDTNGDGYDDVLIGNPQPDSAELHLGPFDGKSSVYDARFESVAAGARDFGISVCGRLDADGDGLGDVGIADPYESFDGSYFGRIYIFTGVVAGDWTTDDAAAVWTGQTDNGGLGWNLAAADLDLDGRDDLIATTTNAYRTYIMFGGDI